MDSIMIEIVTDKDRNLKNLKQIGTPKDEDKIYIENFAYARIKEDSYKEKRVFVLMGHTERMQGKYATFIEAVIPVRAIEFAAGAPCWNNTVWNDVFREIKRLYEDMIIVGWALDVKGMPLKLTPELSRQHREYFGGAHQLMMLVDTVEQDETFFVYKENKLVPKDGFYIYHQARKKEVDRQLDQKYFQRTEQPQEPEVLVEVNIPENVGSRGRYRQMIQEAKTEKAKEGGNLGLALAVAMLLFVVGVGVYENRDQIFAAKNSIETNLLTPNQKQEEQSEKNETETGKTTNKIPIEVIPGEQE